MKQAYRRWVCGLLACILALLAVCGAVVYVVDPCLYYRVPDKWQPVLFNERYQMAGLAKNVEADTVLVGTSMAANYRSSWIQETFGTSAVRLTIPDGYYSEFDQVMNVLFRTQEPERVIFGLDVNTLIRDESGVTAAMPDYLYNANPLDDIQYLLNKDTLYYSAYTLLSNHWERATPSTRDSPGTGMSGGTISPPWRTMTGRRLRRRSCPQMPIGTMWPPIWRWRNGGSQSIRTRNSISSCPRTASSSGTRSFGRGGRRRCLRPSARQGRHCCSMTM